jgi:hypothetical protein
MPLKALMSQNKDESLFLFLDNDAVLVPLTEIPKSDINVQIDAIDCANITFPKFSVPKTRTKYGIINNGTK